MTIKEMYSWLAPIPAAAFAIVPSYPFFDYAAQKRQTAGSITRISVGEAIKAGIRASPNITAIVGSQMLIQQACEEGLKGLYDTREYPLSTSIVTSAVAGASTAHMEYGFTLLTMRDPHPWKNVFNLTYRQAKLYAARNGAAVCGMTSGSCLAGKIKEQEWQKRLKQQHPVTDEAIEYGSSFVSGGIGGLVGHPLNCKIMEEAMRQRGIVPPQLPLWRGAGYRALSVAAFSVVYRANRKALQYLGGADARDSLS